MSRRCSFTCAVTLVVAALTADAAAQPLGTFRWQLQPYCNVVSFVVTQNAGVYNLDGYDDQCVGATRAPATGTATLNPDGSVGFGFNIVDQGASPVHVAAAINPTTLSGTWRDHTGASGTFVFTPGPGTGGSARPVATTTPLIPDLFAFRPDGGLLATGNVDSGSIPASGAGTRLMWYPGKSAFRVGTASSSEWDDSNIGPFSVAFGTNPLASGHASVAGGSNTAASGLAAVAFGVSTAARGAGASAFGLNTQANGHSSFAAGEGSVAAGSYAVALGDSSIANGYSSVAIGALTRASGSGSVALGNQVIADLGAHGAVVLGTHAVAGNVGGNNVASGSLIFGDRSTNDDLLSLGRNEFLMRVAGGVRIYTSANLASGVTVAAGGGSWSSLSDANAKANFRDLDGGDVLAKLARLPIREWNYKTQDAAIRHVGPTAQDFRAAFGLGEDDTRISAVDADGIALAAIQALVARTRALEDEVSALRERLAQLDALLSGRR